MARNDEDGRVRGGSVFTGDGFLVRLVIDSRYSYYIVSRYDRSAQCYVGRARIAICSTGS